LVKKFWFQVTALLLGMKYVVRSQA